MTVTKVGGANMIAHAQWPLCPHFPRVAVFYVTAEQSKMLNNSAYIKYSRLVNNCFCKEITKIVFNCRPEIL